MSGKTFSEKLFSMKSGEDVRAGDIVFAEPDFILSHDNSASIYKTFEKMGGKEIKDPSKLIIVLDHDAPPTSALIANDHQFIRDIVKKEKIDIFYDEGHGICHQLMSNHVLPGQLIVGSDSHTCTSGAFNSFAAGIDRTETAGLWLTGKTWFRVPESIKVILTGKLPKGVYAKDIALWLMGRLTSSGANYKAIEFHGTGIVHLNISERMTLANLASEMGAKTAIFPPDDVLIDYIKKRDKKFDLETYWADSDATYSETIELDISQLVPLISVPHSVDNVKAVLHVQDTPIQQAFIGTCTNARLEDLCIASEIIKDNKIPNDVQLLVAPASREINIQAMSNGSMTYFTLAGANILPSSCGPCLGKGQGIPADNWNVISTANRNFLGRMGNKKAFTYLASPATVAKSALEGKIVDPRENPVITEENMQILSEMKTETRKEQVYTVPEGDNRKFGNVWNYADIDNFNTDQMFAGNLTYDIKSSDPEEIVPHLFKGLDVNFSSNVKKGDIIIAGDNFGCGSSREHPAVGLGYIGVKAVICKSVNRIFYRSAVNQGLPIIVNPEIVNAYKPGDEVEINLSTGKINLEGRKVSIPKLPSELLSIFSSGGLVKYYSRG
jgi:homoaconitate hydratase family protein/3-isopropylmalate dehydratase small subunit